MCPKTLDPVWSTTFTFEVDDESLQDEPLEVRVWDKDIIGNDDAIGKTIIDLAPLAVSGGPSEVRPL